MSMSHVGEHFLRSSRENPDFQRTPCEIGLLVVVMNNNVLTLKEGEMPRVFLSYCKSQNILRSLYQLPCKFACQEIWGKMQTISNCVNIYLYCLQPINAQTIMLYHKCVLMEFFLYILIFILCFFPRPLNTLQLYIVWYCILITFKTKLTICLYDHHKGSFDEKENLL